MGRPRTPLLSADRIADAALELVNTTGGFTMPALAARLGVRPSSLYNHVAGRDASSCPALTRTSPRVPGATPSPTSPVPTGAATPATRG